MADNPVISQLIVGGVTYDIKDRTLPSGAMHFKGAALQKLTDGGTQNAAAASGSPYTGEAGDVYLQHSGDGSGEFVWTGSAWELLGDESSYVIQGTYTTGQTSATDSFKGEFTGEEATITLSGNISAQTLPVSATTDTSVSAVSFSTSYTPGGSVSASGSGASGHTFSGTAATLSTTITPNGSVSASGTAASGHTFSGTAATISITTDDFVTAVQDINYTPGGSVSASGNDASGHTFSGTAGTVNVSTSGTAVTAVDDHSYQPEGTVSKPNVTTTPTKTSITPVTGGTGTAIASVASGTEVLTILDLPTTQYMTSVTAALSATPTFTGKTATISHTLTKGSVSSTGTFTPSGSVKGAHTFSGTAATLSVSPTYDETTLTADYTPAGTIKGAHSFTGSNTAVSIDYTPAGDVLGAHSWTGTAATISFSKRLVAALSAATISASGTYTPEGEITFMRTGSSGPATSGVEWFTVPVASHTHQVNLATIPA